MIILVNKSNIREQCGTKMINMAQQRNMTLKKNDQTLINS